MNKILQKNIIKELGLNKLSEKEQEEAILSAGRIIFQAVLIKVMDVLSEEKKEEFEKIITEEPQNEEKVTDFLQSHVSDLNGIVSQEVINFKQEILNLAKL